MNEDGRVNITPEDMPDAGNFNFLKNLQSLKTSISFVKEKVFYLSMERIESIPNGPVQFQFVHPNITSLQLEEFIANKKYILEKRKDHKKLSISNHGTPNKHSLIKDYYVHFDIRNEWVAVVITQDDIFQREAFYVLNEFHLEYAKFISEMNKLIDI